MVATLAETAQAPVLFLCLPTSEEVGAVLRAAPLRPGSVVVDCTSGDPSVSAELAAMLAASGVAWLDAPVSGGVSGAEAGTLTAMVGGDPAVLARVRPLVATFASNIVHAGAQPGAGHALKAVNNLLKCDMRGKRGADGLTCVRPPVSPI